MAFSSNILPKDSVYYVLDRADISNGVLTIEPGGSASLEITESMLSSITKTMELRLSSTVFCDSYEPNIFIEMNVKPVDGNSMYIQYFPTAGKGILKQVFTLSDGKYEHFIFTIRSKVLVNFSL